jgi:hypothetical protein
MKMGFTDWKAAPVEVTRKRRPPPKTDRRRVTAGDRPEYSAPKIIPAQRVRRLEKVTLPALRCLAGLEFEGRDWRPQGREA